jgi:hypothetical protein
LTPWVAQDTIQQRYGERAFKKRQQDLAYNQAAAKPYFSRIYHYDGYIRIIAVCCYKYGDMIMKFMLTKQ